MPKLSKPEIDEQFFKIWLAELIALAPEYGETTVGCWTTDFNDGLTPQEAIDRDRDEASDD